VKFIVVYSVVVRVVWRQE